MTISKIGPHNTITNASNHHLKIICTNNRQNNCGTAPLNSLQKVYNMEVEKAHNYFVGNTKALVHNGCDSYYKCAACDEAHGEKKLFSIKCKKTENEMHRIQQYYRCPKCSESVLYLIIHDYWCHEVPPDTQYKNPLIAEHSKSTATEEQKIHSGKIKKSELPSLNRYKPYYYKSFKATSSSHDAYIQFRYKSSELIRQRKTSRLIIYIDGIKF